MLDKSSMHRLIGAGIMLVAAISVLPIILDGEKPSDLGLSIQAPSKAPEISVIKIKPVQKLTPLENTSSSPNNVTTANSDNNSVSVKKVDIPAEINVTAKTNEEKPLEQVTKEDVQPTVSVEKLSEAKPARWVVQIASFKNQTNAQDLVKKLQAANYAAYTITTKTLYKVFVGPEIKKSRSETIKQEIKTKFKLEGFVVKYSEN